MRVEHVLVRQRVARQVVESVEARMVQGPTAVQVSPMNQSLLDPPDAVRATLAAQAMLSRRHY
jgi:hypothetical protein